jgi:hypothetical protein
VGAFLFFLWHMFRRGVRLHLEGGPFGLFVIITLMIVVLLLGYDLPFESAIPMLGLCFSGISIMECAPKRISRTIRASDLAHGPTRAAAPAS